MSKIYLTLARTHDGEIVALVGDKTVSIGNVKDLSERSDQDEVIKNLRRDAKGDHEEFAEVYRPMKLSGGYRLKSPEEAKKHADSIKQQQKEYDALVAKRAEDEKAKVRAIDQDRMDAIERDKKTKEAAAAKVKASDAPINPNEPVNAQVEAREAKERTEEEKRAEEAKAKAKAATKPAEPHSTEAQHNHPSVHAAKSQGAHPAGTTTPSKK